MSREEVAPVTLSERERRILEHSLAWPKRYRNHYAADVRSPNGEVCLDLTRRGLMTRGSEIPGGLVYFHVTGEGIAALEAREVTP